ncbi:MAG TPA: hypothetical protein VMV81_07790 [Phycisphaerae bacterium]|nr:hypothetical protein [Phycisphaerae bacterium]
MKILQHLVLVATLACGGVVLADDAVIKKVGGNRLITLNMKKGDVADALRLVAEQGGLNLVIGPEVRGELSVYLSEAPLEIALKAIATNNGFNYRVDDDVITVAKVSDKTTGPDLPPVLVTNIFTLRSQDAERVKDALEFALSKYGKMKVLNQNSQDGYGVQRLNSLGGDVNGGGGGGYGGFAAPGMAMGQQPNIMGGMASGLQHHNQPLSQEQPRNARVLVVTDIPENVDRISHLIADLDKLPPQVLIEARIVEMSTDLQRQLGIDWNVNVLANGPILNHAWPLNNRAGFASGSQVMRHFSGTPYQSAGLSLGTVDFSQFSALLRANQSDASVRLLANPRLLVYNNHSASILVGERYPILQANISNYGTATESLQTYIPVGVQLEVTPTIMMDGTISMLVHPATSALGDDVVGTTGLKVARINTRELDTRVIMADSQTIVLGGLISDRKTHQANKVPGLGDIPVLSIFFRQENPRSERVDLLVFLTAHVECATQISERDQKVFEMYKPHFKQIEHLQDVPLHFEIPTEYAPPRPMFSEPPIESEDNIEAANEPVSAARSPNSKSVFQKSPAGAARPGAGASDQTPHDDGAKNAEEDNSDTVPRDPEPIPRSRGLRHVRGNANEDLNHSVVDNASRCPPEDPE